MTSRSVQDAWIESGSAAAAVPELKTVEDPREEAMQGLEL